MKRFGLTGYPLTHSFSKKYFEEKFKSEHISGCIYELFPLHPIDGFLSLVEINPDLCGLNVTIPYKESVIEYLDELDASASEIGAVNCIKISEGVLKGYNTDAKSFEESLEKFLNVKPAQAFVLGTGGAAKAVVHVLQKMNIELLKISRTPGQDSIAYNQVAMHLKESNLIINTTPLGMFPDEDAAPDIPYNKLTEKDFLFDLIYNPGETKFLQKGKTRGAKTKNGLEMLELQAEKSWEIWNSQEQFTVHSL